MYYDSPHSSWVIFKSSTMVSPIKGLELQTFSWIYHVQHTSLNSEGDHLHPLLKIYYDYTKTLAQTYKIAKIKINFTWSLENLLLLVFFQKKSIFFLSVENQSSKFFPRTRVLDNTKQFTIFSYLRKSEKKPKSALHISLAQQYHLEYREFQIGEVYNTKYNIINFCYYLIIILWDLCPGFICAICSFILHKFRKTFVLLVSSMTS